MTTMDSFLRNFRMHELEAWSAEIWQVLDTGRVRWDGFVDDLFSDGSALDPAIAEMCRSAWAAVRASGKIAGHVASGVVHGGRHFAPRAELMAAVATLAVSRQFRLHSDCSSFVNGFRDLQVCCRPSKRLFASGLAAGREPDLVKVKAHLDVTSATGDQDLFEIVGNDIADRGQTCRA